MNLQVFFNKISILALLNSS